MRFFSVAELKALLDPFVTPGGGIVAFPRGNFFIILDLAANVQRLLEIKDLVDVNVFAGARMELYQPKVASSDELAEKMKRLAEATRVLEQERKRVGPNSIEGSSKSE